MADTVETLRRFNRTYTQRIGALDESFLASGRSLGQSRLLFEIGQTGADVLELRDRLGLDSGYLSRLLRALEADGLVAVAVHESDARRRTARLTRAGTDEWRRLDRRSDELAAALVEPLTGRQRAELAEALTAASRLISAATVTFDAVDPSDADAQAAIHAYFRELDERFPTGFDPGDAATSDVDALAPPSGTFVVARAGTETVGCGGVQLIDYGTGEIKRMWVHPNWRGVGLGRRLLAELESRAVSLGYRRVVLDTNGELAPAINLYERSGYEPIERYNDNPYAQRWFSKRLADSPTGPPPSGSGPW